MVRAAWVLGMVVGCGGGGGEELAPDAAYEVRVETAVTDGAVVSNCLPDGSEYALVDDTFTYELFFEGTNATVNIDGESFATGVRSGCKLDYTSVVWLEERPSGNLQWQVSGSALYDALGGACGLSEGLQWEGTESITIVASDDEDIPEGCTYEMVTTGTLIGG
jgi:hypothetical protein